MKLLYKHMCWWCASLMLFPGCLIPSRYFMRQNIFIVQPSARVRNAQTSFSNERRTITIWIHGTRLFFNRLYQEGLPQHEGLGLAQNLALPHRLKVVAPTLHKADPERFDLAHFYIYGWSGKLCFIEREKAAQRLHNELANLVQTYEQTYGSKPFVRIIAHSHGGNVALNLALQSNSTLTIDELILLACPVQEHTQHLANNHQFKKIYALYSALDIVQILDPQGMYKHRSKPDAFFSKRNFAHRDGLAQMKVKVDRRAITHFEFTQSSFLNLLPSILTGIDTWHSTICYKEDPNKMSKVLCVYTKKPLPKSSIISI